MTRSFPAALLSFIFVILGVMFGPTMARSEPLLLDPAQDAYSATPHATQYLTVPFMDSLDPALQVPNFLKLVAEGAFRPIEARRVIHGVTASYVTLRLPVVSTLDDPQDWIISANRAPQYTMTVFFIEDGAPPPTEPVSHFDSFLNREGAPEDVMLHARFTMPAQTSGTLFITLGNLNSEANITLETPDHYLQKRKWQDIGIFTSAGLVLGLVMLTTAAMLTLGQVAALPYAASVIAGLIAVLASESYLSPVLRPFGWDAYQDYFYLYSMVFSPAFALLFQRTFLGQFGLGRWYGHLLIFLSIGLIAGMIIVLEFEVLEPAIMVAFIVLTIILIPINGIVGIVRRIPGRWFFALGALVLCVGLILKVLTFTPFSFLTSREASLVFLGMIGCEAICLATTMFIQVRQMILQKGMAEQAQRELAQMVSHTAHDLQQPISALRLALQATDKDAATVTQAINYLENMVAAQLAQTNPNTKDEGQDETGEPVALQTVLSVIDTMFTGEAAAKGIDLRIVPCSALVKTDLFGLTRIASNLVANAIRNTDDGRVLIGCRAAGAWVDLAVYDEGHGMTAETLEKVNAAYVREGAYPGTGLGLPIVQALCVDHDLRLSVKSIPGRGSCFRVRIPKDIS